MVCQWEFPAFAPTASNVTIRAANNPHWRPIMGRAISTRLFVRLRDRWRVHLGGFDVYIDGTLTEIQRARVEQDAEDNQRD
jgi:hypothetical protein